MREAIIDFFNFFVIFYSGFLVLSYVLMVILAVRKHRLHGIYHNEKNTIEELRHSPYATGIPSWRRPITRKGPLSIMSIPC